MATLEQIFGARNLTRTVQNVKSGLPIRVDARFFNPTDTFNGKTAEWLQVDGNRDLASVVAYGSPAKRVGQQGVTHRSARMIHSFESQPFEATKLMNLISENQQRQQMGEQEVARQTRWFKQRLTNLVQTSVQFMLLNGELHFNEKGELLHSSSGAVFSIDCGIPAGQKDQLDILGDGDIIDASWSDSSTDIILQLATIREQMLQLGGWQMTTAYYGKNIPGYVAGNDVAKEYINRTDSLAREAFERPNEVPQGFQNFNWQPMGDLFYIDANGTVRKMLGDDEIVFTPDFGDEWWFHANGSFPIPRTFANASMDATQAMQDLEEAFGMFSYAKLEHNPPSVEQFAGHTWLPAIRATKAWCKADVTP